MNVPDAFGELPVIRVLSAENLASSGPLVLSPEAQTQAKFVMLTPEIEARYAKAPRAWQARSLVQQHRWTPGRHRARCAGNRHLTHGQVLTRATRTLALALEGDKEAWSTVMRHGGDAAGTFLHPDGGAHLRPLVLGHLALYLTHEPVPEHAPEETPALECSCGWYGWYPWISERLRGFSPWHRTAHPAVQELGYRFLGFSCVHVVLAVMMVSGTVVPHEIGVRAQDAEIKALIDPLSALEASLGPDHRVWADQLYYSPNATNRRDVPITGRLERAWEAAQGVQKSLNVPIVPWGAAVSSSELWSGLVPRLPIRAQLEWDLQG